jgi:maltose O-acetyltransferase
MNSNTKKITSAAIHFWRKIEWHLLQFKGWWVFGRPVIIHGNFRVDDPWNVEIGKGCHINRGVFILGNRRIVIGNNVTLSANSMLLDAGLSTEDPNRGLNRSHTSSDIIIEDNVWICAGATVIAGVRIGSGSIIGAGAVVTRDVPANCIYAGVPARFIRKLESS